MRSLISLQERLFAPLGAGDAAAGAAAHNGGTSLMGAAAGGHDQATERLPPLWRPRDV